MAKGTNKQLSNLSTRQIPHTRLFDDGSLDIRYDILNKLGEGSFGTVYRVEKKETNTFYAMKTIPKKLGTKSKVFSLDNEVKLLTEINHPNLIQLHEVLESSQNLYLIIELCEGGELGAYVKRNGPLPEETIKQIMSKLINALHYLHKIDVVHRDLKLENILLKNTPTSKTDQFDIRVTDFGLSSKKSITSTDTLFNDYCGTPLYMAPEILENKNYSALCDVWAMGIIMYYLISGRHPYVASDERRLLEMIRSTKLRFDSEKFRHLSPQGLDFLQGMLIYDTVHRRTMGELTVHPWLTGRFDKEPSKDIITMMREFHAETNLTALINATASHVDLSSTTRDQSVRALDNVGDTHAHLEQTKTHTDTPGREEITDQDKSNVKTNRFTSGTVKGSRRSINATHDLKGTSSSIHVRITQNGVMPDPNDAHQRSQTNNYSTCANSTKPRTSHIRLGRSRSQIDRPNVSKLPPQRTTPNGAMHLRVSHSPSVSIRSSNDHCTSILTRNSPSSTATALMMINKQYSNNPSIFLPTITNHHEHNPKKIPLYDKRYCHFI